jgi:hypothetical protein
MGDDQFARTYVAGVSPSREDDIRPTGHIRETLHDSGGGSSIPPSPSSLRRCRSSRAGEPGAVAWLTDLLSVLEPEADL